MIVTHREIDRRLLALWATMIILPFVFWIHHNHASTGEPRWSSSWNGENLFRGYNSGAAVIFPEISLDRAFDSTIAIIGDGKVVPLGNFSNLKCFEGEWAWNDYYGNEAVQWVRRHFQEALAFDLRKAWVFLVEVRHTPTFISATDKTPSYSMGTNAVMIGWMIYARILFFLLLVLTITAARLRSRRRYYWVPVILGAACAPYVAVFGWQRHVVPILVMAGTFLVFLHMSQSRSSPRAS